MNSPNRDTQRGSRRHVLDWVESPEFASELLALCAPADVQYLDEPRYAPYSWEYSVEAKLDLHGPELLGPDEVALPNVWRDLAAWWLKHRAGANTPNWDLVCACSIGGTPGLILVEAKTDEAELDARGKALAPNASSNSTANHARIGAALGEAGKGLSAFAPGISLSVDNAYQLSNRLAFAWWLAAHRVPVVLVYLGFTGDTGMRGAFASGEQWSEGVRVHFAGVNAESLLERKTMVDGTPLWVLARSREVISVSPFGRDVTAAE